MIAPQIQDLITAAKAMPNSLERNKLVSHLEDARAWAIVLQTKVPRSLAATEPAPANCICPPGAIDATCSVHGGATIRD